MTPHHRAGIPLGDEGMHVWLEEGPEHGLCKDFTVWVLQIPGTLYGGRWRGFTLEIALALPETVPVGLGPTPREKSLEGLPEFTWNEGEFTLTRARVYFEGNPDGPRLELLQRSGYPERLSMHGLEVASLGEGERLLHAVRALRRVVAGGRPPGPSSGWCEIVAKAKTLKNPSLTWDQVAARLGVAERTLRRYRQQAS